MDRPLALVGWYYLPLAVVYAAAIISIATNIPLLAPLVIFVMLITSSVLTRLYNVVTGRRPPGLRDPRQRPWTIATLVVSLAGLAVGFLAHLHRAPFWSAGVAAVVVAIVMVVGGGAYEAAMRPAPAPSDADVPAVGERSAS